MNMTKADVDRAFGRLKKQVAADKRKIPRLSDRELELIVDALFWLIAWNEECRDRGCGSNDTLKMTIDKMCSNLTFKVTKDDRKKIAQIYKRKYVNP